MAGGDEPDAGHVVEGVEGVVELHAGESENHAHAFEVQRTHQGLAAGHGGHNNTFLGSFTWFCILPISRATYDSTPPPACH